MPASPAGTAAALVPAAATAEREGAPHGQDAQEDPRGLLILSPGHPHRAASRSTHAIVTGEPRAPTRDTGPLASASRACASAGPFPVRAGRVGQDVRLVAQGHRALAECCLRGTGPFNASSVTSRRPVPCFRPCSAIQVSFLLTHSSGRNVVTNNGACVNDNGENGPAIMYGY
jgi:hypothetical protein